MGCCGKNSDDGRSDNVEMKGGPKGGKTGKWGEFCIHYKCIQTQYNFLAVCQVVAFDMKAGNVVLVGLKLQV